MGNKLVMPLIVVSLALVAFLVGYIISQGGFASKDSLAENALGKFGSYDKQGPILGQSSVKSSDFIPLGRPGIVSPTILDDNDTVAYYEKSTGKAYAAGLATGKEDILLTNGLPDFISTAWSPTKKEVVSLFYKSNGSIYKYLNRTDNKSKVLDGTIADLVFSPSGKQIAYFSRTDDGNKIYISQPNGDAPKPIFSTRIHNLKIYWPSEDNLSFQTMDERSNLFTLSKAESLTKILESRSNLAVKWSPSGKRLLYSSKDSRGATMLFSISLSDQKEIPIGISTTASKCAWSLNEESIICGITKQSGHIGDSLYEIALADNSKKLLLDPLTKIRVKEIILSSLENYIIVLSDLSDHLYYFRRGD